MSYPSEYEPEPLGDPCPDCGSDVFENPSTRAPTCSGRDCDWSIPFDFDAEGDRLAAIWEDAPLRGQMIDDFV